MSRRKVGTISRYYHETKRFGRMGVGIELFYTPLNMSASCTDPISSEFSRLSC